MTSFFIQGREIVRIIGVAKAGPWTGQVVTQVVEWQLEHPEGTKEECEQWLQTEHAAGRININVPSTVTRPPQSKRGKGTSEGEKRKKLKSAIEGSS